VATSDVLADPARAAAAERSADRPEHACSGTSVPDRADHPTHTRLQGRLWHLHDLQRGTVSHKLATAVDATGDTLRRKLRRPSYQKRRPQLPTGGHTAPPAILAD